MVETYRLPVTDVPSEQFPGMFFSPEGSVELPLPDAPNARALLVPVNYGISLEDAYKEGGYDSDRNPHISSRYLKSERTGIDIVPLYVVGFESEVGFTSYQDTPDYSQGPPPMEPRNGPEPVMLSQRAMNEGLARMGLRAAVPHETLAVGAIHPDLQCQCDIRCIGESWRVNEISWNLELAQLEVHGEQRRVVRTYMDDSGLWGGCVILATPVEIQA